MTKPIGAVAVLEREAPAAVARGGDVDIQIATAKQYPRSIRAFIDKSLEMATLNEETARACFYALPRDGKTVTGPSARLAEICASAYGHLRVQARIVDEDDRFITARGEAWDVENNVAIAFEVRRRITTSAKPNKPAAKYSDDMIVVTGNAASSIALRNAVFKAIPSAFWRPIYEQARVVAVGNAQTLATRRLKMLDHFQALGVEKERVFGLLGVRGVEDITLEKLEEMIGISTAIKEGDTTIDEAFESAPQTPQRTSEQTTTKGTDHSSDKPVAGEVASAVAGAVAGANPPPVEQPKALPDGCDKILETERPKPESHPRLWVGKTQRGIDVYGYTPGVDLAKLQASGVVVRLTLGERPWGKYTEVTQAAAVG